ncbi:MAG: Undecaprenol kinase [Bacteroidetes bacterium MED-G17]|nr:MAG: Undecaprenol kinase [Bacteroidetes bacterium MED-G17]|tara:strand:+ start:1483 stop:1833 length:351 start_codon:yes stop_codon:yes gene_type:complete
MLKKILKSIQFAISGLIYALSSERNLKIQSLVFIFVIFFGFYFHIHKHHWQIILCMSACVFCAELVNTSIEKLCNFVEPEKNEHIKLIKDVAAGAVLIAALFALVIGISIFIPYFF